MKKHLRTLALFLVLASLMSVFGAYAFADGLQSAGEQRGGAGTQTLPIDRGIYLDNVIGRSI